MSDDRSPIRRQLDAWREQGADRLDPMRFHLMDALERRACGYDGAARRVIDERLAVLASAYAERIDASTEDSRERRDDDVTPDPLAELHAHIAQTTAKLDAPSRDVSITRMSNAHVLDEFRRIWTTVRTESQMRQAMAPAPENAGPLNSSALAHRSIALMRELSPGYLQQFLAYVDDLAWIEQMQSSRPAAPRETRRAPAAKKRTRSRAPRE